MSLFLDKFEHIMKDCEVPKGDWPAKLYPKLPERLCARVRSLVEEGVEYPDIRCTLLTSVGETVASYGHKLFSITSDTFRNMTADQIMEYMTRLFKGLFQGAKDCADQIYVLTRTIMRQFLPRSGRVFLEALSIQNQEDLRKGLEAWLSTRVRGDYYKAQGGSHNNSDSRRYDRNERYGREGTRSEGRPTCFVCGKLGHKSMECRYRGADNYRGGARSPNVDQVTGSFPRGRPPVCYTCNKEGHKSPDCSNKGKTAVTVKKEKSTESASMGPVSITVPKREKKNVVKGKVNGVEVDILIDSGADYGLVPRKLVPEDAFCGQKCQVTGITKGTVLYELADVCFELPGVKLNKRVLVEERDSPSPWCLLPLDLKDVGELQVYLNALHNGSICVMTRSQYAEEEAFRNDDDIKLSPCGVPEGTNEGNQWVESGDDNESEIVSNSSDVVEFREDAEERQDEEMPSGPVAEADELVGGRAMLDSSPLVADVSAEVERLEPSGVEENKEWAQVNLWLTVWRWEQVHLFPAKRTEYLVRERICLVVILNPRKLVSLWKD